MPIDFLSLERLLTVADIKKTKEWQAIHNARQASKNEDIYDSANEQENDTPQDLIDKGIKRLNSQLIGDLIDNFKNINPTIVRISCIESFSCNGVRRRR